MKANISTKVKVPTNYQLRVNYGTKPRTLKTTNTKEKYPFSKLNVGDSLFVSGSTARDMRNVIYSATQRYGHRYISRTVQNGARVWRVK